MPISLAELSNETRKFTATMDRDSYWVQYKPHELTPAREAQLVAAINERNRDDFEDNGDYSQLPLLVMMADLLVDWDVEGPLIAKFTVYEEPENEYDEPTEIIYNEGDVMIPAGEHVPPTVDNLAHISSRLIGNTFAEIQRDLSADPKSRKNSRGGSFRRGR